MKFLLLACVLAYMCQGIASMLPSCWENNPCQAGTQAYADYASIRELHGPTARYPTVQGTIHYIICQQKRNNRCRLRTCWTGFQFSLDEQKCTDPNALDIEPIEDVVEAKATDCFRDNEKEDERIVNWMTFGSVTAMTRTLCTSICLNNDFPVAAMRYGFKCFCGKADTDYKQLGPSEDCDKPCAGETTEMCGGTNAISVIVSALPDKTV